MRRREALRGGEMLAQGTSWRSREGYGRTLWGMDPEKVIAVEPTAVVTPSGLRVATSVAGNPAVALYRFSRKRLFSVSVDIDTLSPEIGYWELLADLSAKYGGPDEKFAQYARWDGVQTAIELFAVETSRKAMTRIKYTSTVVVARPEGL